MIETLMTSSNVTQEHKLTLTGIVSPLSDDVGLSEYKLAGFHFVENYLYSS